MAVSVEEQKQNAASFAAGMVEEGMVVGLGSGSTAEKLVESLGERYKAGLRFFGVPTSRETARIAQTYGIPLKRLDELHELDLAIDGADEVDPSLNLIKGRGGALMREKLVANAARRFVVIVDESKLVDHLGAHAPIPVEVVQFGWTTTRHRLEGLGLTCDLRGSDQPYVTSNDNYILDCHLPPDAHLAMAELAHQIKLQTGVVEHGLFLEMASTVVIGTAAGSVEARQR